MTYERCTGQEHEEARERIRKNPPDILLTNDVMLELIVTQIEERQLVDHAQRLKFQVCNELHTYQCCQGADAAMLTRRCQEAFQYKELLCVRTSATMATEGTSVQQSELVTKFASKSFGQTIEAKDVLVETLSPNPAETHFSVNVVNNQLVQIISGAVDFSEAMRVLP